MPLMGLTAKSARDGPTDPKAKRATVRDGKKVFEGRDDVVERLWKIHCLTDCVKTVGPHALKVLFLLLVVTVWKAGLPDVGGLVQLLRAVKLW